MAINNFNDVTNALQEIVAQLNSALSQQNQQIGNFRGISEDQFLYVLQWINELSNGQRKPAFLKGFDPSRRTGNPVGLVRSKLTMNVGDNQFIYDPRDTEDTEVNFSLANSVLRWTFDGINYFEWNPELSEDGILNLTGGGGGGGTLPAYDFLTSISFANLGTDEPSMHWSWRYLPDGTINGSNQVLKPTSSESGLLIPSIYNNLDKDYIYSIGSPTIGTDPDPLGLNYNFNYRNLITGEGEVFNLNIPLASESSPGLVTQNMLMTSGFVNTGTSTWTNVFTSAQNALTSADFGDTITSTTSGMQAVDLVPYQIQPSLPLVSFTSATLSQVEWTSAIANAIIGLVNVNAELNRDINTSLVETMDLKRRVNLIIDNWDRPTAPEIPDLEYSVWWTEYDQWNNRLFTLLIPFNGLSNTMTPNITGTLWGSNTGMTGLLGTELTFQGPPAGVQQTVFISSQELISAGLNTLQAQGSIIPVYRIGGQNLTPDLYVNLAWSAVYNDNTFGPATNRLITADEMLSSTADEIVLEKGKILAGIRLQFTPSYASWYNFAVSLSELSVGI